MNVPSTVTPHRRVTAVLAALLVATAVLVPAQADASDDRVITIAGGGWGHAIGMPQYAARGMAEDQWTAASILDYFYTGTSLADLSATNGAGLPDRLRIGTTIVAGQTRPFRWLDVAAVGGPVEVCLDGETAGGCSFSAQPGETWRVAWNTSPAGCSIRRDSTTVWGPGACNIRLEWDDQPDVLVVYLKISTHCREPNNGGCSIWSRLSFRSAMITNHCGVRFYTT